MKNTLFISTILLICAFLVGFDLKDNNIYQIVGVESADTFYVDFNKNSIADPNEIVQLWGIKTFNTQLYQPQAKTAKITPSQAVALGYLGRKFAQQNFLGQNVKVTIEDKKSSPIKVKIEAQNGDIAEQITQQGYGTSNFRENLKTSTELNLVLVNKKSLKYHALDCKYAQKSNNIELMPIADAQKIAKPCRFCHQKIKTDSLQPETYNPPNEPNKPYFTDGVVSLYVTNPNLFMDAPDNTRSSITKALIEAINQAQLSINFATYGVEGQKSIINSLIKAQNRCVNVRWVTDMEPNGLNIYKNTIETIKLLKNVATDFGANASALMHNKFFIFDDKVVFAGSGNLSNTDLSGLNANVFLKINSDKVANVFTEEFEQMYHGFFHQAKQEIPSKTNIKLKNNNVISVYFSPKDRIISTAIVPLINNAHEYIYMPIFFLTDNSVAQALIAAKSRGVEVRVIIDAVAAENKYSKHKLLRQAKIPVKTEDWAGKMHQKSLIIDDNTVVIGSMNFSKSGDIKNDENCVIVQNAPELACKYKQYFLMLYNSIPNKWLTKDPRPESPDSIGSCFDKVDNDFDGKIDAADEGCFRAMHKKY